MIEIIPGNSAPLCAARHRARIGDSHVNGGVGRGSGQSESRTLAHTSVDGPIGVAGTRWRQRRANRGNRGASTNSDRRGALYLSRPRIRCPRYVLWSERGVPGERKSIFPSRREQQRAYSGPVAICRAITRALSHVSPGFYLSLTSTASRRRRRRPTGPLPPSSPVSRAASLRPATLMRVCVHTSLDTRTSPSVHRERRPRCRHHPQE